MHIHDLDEVNYELEVDGELVRRQLARKIWEDRGWATVAVYFVEKDKDGAWKSPKVAILRFRRMHDAWKREAAVTLAEDTARELAEWITGRAS
jgi:hypothetical protein